MLLQYIILAATLAVAGEFLVSSPCFYHVPLADLGQHLILRAKSPTSNEVATAKLSSVMALTAVETTSAKKTTLAAMALAIVLLALLSVSLFNKILHLARSPRQISSQTITARTRSRMLVFITVSTLAAPTLMERAVVIGFITGVRLNTWLVLIVADQLRLWKTHTHTRIICMWSYVAGH